jgi:hypothetical protein
MRDEYSQSLNVRGSTQEVARMDCASPGLRLKETAIAPNQERVASAPLIFLILGDLNGHERLLGRDRIGVKAVLVEAVEGWKRAVAADAPSIGKDIVTAVRVFQTNGQAPCAGPEVNMQPVPTAMEVVESVVEQLLLSGDGGPGGVVEGGGGLGRIVARRKKPVGSKLDTPAEVGHIQTAWIGQTGLRKRDRGCVQRSQKDET